MNIQDYQSDEKKKSEGVWVEWEGAEFLIRSTDTKEYRRAVANLSRKYSSAKLRKDPETHNKISIGAIINGVLIDWKGVLDDGAELPCTPENKKKVISAIPALRDFLSAEAGEMENFNMEAVAKDSEEFQEGD